MFRIIFFGTSDFAAPHLDALIRDPSFQVIAVVTQADKPVGRHAELKPPPVKLLAQRFGITVFQPQKIAELKDDARFQNLLNPRPDVGVIVSYGKILPQWILDLPAFGIVNVHASLLPRWRGASPIQAAIAAGDRKTGVTVMKIDAEMDHGPLLATEEEIMRPEDTAGALSMRLARRGAALLPKTLAEYLNKKILPTEQNHAKAIYCKILTRDDGKIDWNRTSSEIERLVRAYDPWPGTWMELGDKRLKILKARIRPNDAAFKAGTRFLWKGRPSVKCGQGTVIELETVQPEGKIPMSGEAFTRGYQNWISLKEKLESEMV
ncbi:methionyl-tRNA formyltransferase [Patescibacteria group bacterium]|nr:methionyl-tRNA formyltransferase [Patescibacteria group bacterium]MBU1908223.1 methionyl-tRNA formyltransferase [Patescibacteria group bacterium]